jgi:hypothetical protein
MAAPSQQPAPAAHLRKVSLTSLLKDASGDNTSGSSLPSCWSPGGGMQGGGGAGEEGSVLVVQCTGGAVYWWCSVLVVQCTGGAVYWWCSTGGTCLPTWQLQALLHHGTCCS